MIKICHKSIKKWNSEVFYKHHLVFYCRFNKCIGCGFVEIGDMQKIMKRKVQIIRQTRGVTESMDTYVSSLNIACVIMTFVYNSDGIMQY